jgi:hypothetical protein
MKVLVTAATIALLLLAMLLGQAQPAPTPAFISNRLVGILYADDGKFSGTGEAEFVIAQLINATSVNLPDCGLVMTGYLAGNATMIPVIVAATGIGSLNAAMCTRTVLEFAAVTEIVWTGTSGLGRFTKGGFNPKNATGGCSQPTLTHDRAVQPIGSMCVTSVAADMSCGLCVHSNDPTSLDECSALDCSLRTQQSGASLFGPCVPMADPKLAEKVFKIGSTTNFPQPPKSLVDAQSQYWMASGYNVAPSVFHTPRVSKDCIEGDLRTILASGPKDFACRETTAEALNTLYSTTSYTPDSVTCFVAMEGIGLLQVTNKRPDLPVVIIRGGANWDMYPPYQDTTSGRWNQNFTFISPTAHGRMTTEGYRYSIQTTNFLVLQYVASLN